MLMSDLSASVSKAALTAGENLTLGQVVAYAADNTLYGVVDPNNPANVPLWRPMNQAATAYGVPATASGYTINSLTGGNPAGSIHQNACQLTNGNIASVWTALTTDAVTIAITNQAGQQVLPPTVIGTEPSSEYGYVSICALTGGGFAVAYYGATDLQLETFNAAGVSQGTYTTSALDATYELALVGLTSGGFAVAYNTGTINFGVFTAACTVTQAIAAGPVTSGANSFKLIALSGGGFVIYYYSTTTQTSFVIYNNMGAVSVPATNSLAPLGVGGITAAPLAGGGFGVMAMDTHASTTGMSVAVYNASGVEQGSALALDTTIGSPSTMYPLCGGLDGSLYAAWYNSGWLIAKIGANGIQVGSTVSVSGAAAGALGFLVPQSDNGVTLLSAIPNGTGSITVSSLSSTLAPEYPSFSMALSSTNITVVGFCYAASALCPAPTGVIACTVNGNFTVQTFAYCVQKAQVIGVTQAAVAAKASVQMQYVGKITLNTAFLQPFQIATAAGCSLSIVGNKALMSNTAKSAGYIGAFSNSTITFTAPVNCAVKINYTSGNGAISVNGVGITPSSASGSATVYVTGGATITITGAGSSASGSASFVGV